jgi:hypothetical protein
MAQAYFYDGQIRRFVTQFIRMMSNFQVEFGKDRNGAIALQRVPVVYGDVSRQAAMILRNNSENSLNAVPAMAVYINGLQYDQSRMQEPFFVSKLNLRQKSYDPMTGEYGTTQDSAYTVERMMPVPYKLTLKLDIWTSNTEQKLQLVEQIGVLFNPSMEIQSTDNYIDWTSLTVVTRTDLSWSSRSVPTGGEEPIDICTMTFEIPIWISGPAKVKQLGVVQKIITSIFDANGNLDENAMAESNLLARKMLTPLHYSVLFTGNTLKLLKKNEMSNADGTDKIGTADFWKPLIGMYGSLKDGASQVRLQLAVAYDEIDGVTATTELVGTIAYHPTDDTLLLFTLDTDTAPANTLDPIDAIIDPRNVNVDDNNLLTPTAGTRYLILDGIGTGTAVWGNLTANANDIIEFNGTNWTVSLDSTDHSTLEYVTNLTTGVQYKWLAGNWTKSIDGVYHEGEWSIIL